MTDRSAVLLVMQLARGAQTDRDRENELGRKKGILVVSVATVLSSVSQQLTHLTTKRFFDEGADLGHVSLAGQWSPKFAHNLAHILDRGCSDLGDRVLHELAHFSLG